MNFMIRNKRIFNSSTMDIVFQTSDHNYLVPIRSFEVHVALMLVSPGMQDSVHTVVTGNNLHFIWFLKFKIKTASLNQRLHNKNQKRITNIIFLNHLYNFARQIYNRTAYIGGGDDLYSGGLAVIPFSKSSNGHWKASPAFHKLLPVCLKLCFSIRPL